MFFCKASRRLTALRIKCPEQRRPRFSPFIFTACHRAEGEVATRGGPPFGPRQCGEIPPPASSGSFDLIYARLPPSYDPESCYKTPPCLLTPSLTAHKHATRCRQQRQKLQGYQKRTWPLLSRGEAAPCMSGTSTRYCDASPFLVIFGVSFDA